MHSNAEARLEPDEIFSFAMDGESSFFMPHFTQAPKIALKKERLETHPYVVLNNGQALATLFFHCGEYSKDPNFVISMLWNKLVPIFKASTVRRKVLYLQVSKVSIIFSFLIQLI
jgi:hypothetical protein